MQPKSLLKYILPEPVKALRRRWRDRKSFSRRLERVGQAVARHCKNRVVAGPFRGMRYVSEAFYSGYAPKLLGCYEAELHTVVRRVLARNYHVIVDVGAAEGYYAVGFAFALPKSKVYAFESVEHARNLCGVLASLNGVADRVVLAGDCNPAALRDIRLDADSFIICDCEGYELELIDPAAVPGLALCDLLVEMHDCFNPSITPTLLARFAPTHDILLISSQPHDPAQFPSAQFLPLVDQKIAVDDLRAAKLQWAFMTVRSGAAQVVI